MTEAARPEHSIRLLTIAAMQCRSGAPRLEAVELSAYVDTLPDWKLAGDRIEKEFIFRSHHETMAFVNALAWIAHREDHHPDLRVLHSRCIVTFSTHDALGVTLNDIICAARVERLFA